jgi:hypothetical protein
MKPPHLCKTANLIFNLKPVYFMKTFLLRFPTLVGATLFTTIALAQPGKGNGPTCNLNRVSDTTVWAEKGMSGAIVKFPSPNENNACGTITYSPASGSQFPLGTTKVTAAATSGVTKEFNVTVLNAEPLVITCPASIITSTDATGCSATITNLGTPTVSDVSVIPVGTRSDNQPLNSPYPKGTTTITWTATNGAGSVTTCEQLIVVSDEIDPVMVLPFTDAAITRNTDAGVCTYTVKGTEFDATATDNCASAVAISYSWWGASSGNANNSLAGVVFEKGTTTVWCTASDGNGNVAEWTFNVTVEDHQAPVINSVKATPDVLWAPNHKMTDITLTYDVTENCPGLTYQIVSITSNEPVNDLGDGNTNVDWYEGTDGLHLQLRAERSGTGTGRIYTIVVKVKDDAGNESEEATVTVTVPHDKGNKEGAADHKSLDMTVAPNPSQQNFTIKATSENTTDKITLTVSDSMGRPVYRKTDIMPGQTITMGSDWQPGTYFVELRQGNVTTQRQVIKVK